MSIKEQSTYLPLENAWRYLYALAIVAFFIALLHHHGQILFATIPLDYYEGTMPFITGIIADGHNPYTKPFQPVAMDAYPPLYNILVAPLTRVFDNNLLLHRAVSAAFIVIACLLCLVATYRHSQSWLNSVAAGVTFYAALLFYSTPVASTNAVGVTFFMAIIVIPWLREFSNRSLVFALLCGVLAFYSKQYFIVAMAMLCLYMFLYISMYRALLLGVVFAACLLASVAVVHKTSPYFLDNTLFSTAISTARLQTSEMVTMQLLFFAKTYWVLLLLPLVVTLRWITDNGLTSFFQRVRDAFATNCSQLRGPLMATRANYFWFCLFWATVAIIVSLGRNPGNFMTYLFQLMSPFLLIASFAVVSRLQGRLKLLLPLVLVVFYQTYAILPKDFSTTEANWAKVNGLINSHDNILASQIFLMTLLENNKKVYQDGHTFYFPLAKDKPRLFIKDRPEDRVEAIWAQYITDIYRKIEAKQFDLILVSPWDFNGIFGTNPPPYADVDGASYLKRFYQLDDKFPISMTNRYGGGTWGIQAWRPKP
ncbi:MAG: ArnT family glycosyltransferase [Pseudomonadales bacterium]